MADVRKLPLAIVEVWDWQTRGACRGLDSDVFFHPERERGRAKDHREAVAKQVCQSCPVQEACRRHALDVREPYGVWGGMTVSERDDVIRAEEKATDHPSTVVMLGAQRSPASPPVPGGKR